MVFIRTTGQHYIAATTRDLLPGQAQRVRDERGLEVDIAEAAQLVEALGRHRIRGVSPWRDKVAEAGLKESARMIRDAGLTVTGYCRAGIFPANERKQRQAAIVRGGQIFLTNCTACHNFEGSGGAMPRGGYAPKIRGVEPRYIYEALLTGPQNMPSFSNGNLSPAEKRDVIAYLG